MKIKFLKFQNTKMLKEILVIKILSKKNNKINIIIMINKKNNQVKILIKIFNKL